MAKFFIDRPVFAWVIALFILVLGSVAITKLPVTQQGVRVDKARSNFLLFTILSSDDPAWDPVALGDFASRNVLPEIQRIPGVGQAQLFGTERSMRIWLDPAKLVSYNLSATEVN